jgi:hypothetical protein
MGVIVGTKGVFVTTVPTSEIDVSVGTPGKPGPPGPEGGTPVVALPYNQWPPVDPQPNTLYLRLAP